MRLVNPIIIMIQKWFLSGRINIKLLIEDEEVFSEKLKEQEDFSFWILYFLISSYTKGPSMKNSERPCFKI